MGFDPTSVWNWGSPEWAEENNAANSAYADYVQNIRNDPAAAAKAMGLSDAETAQMINSYAQKEQAQATAPIGTPTSTRVGNLPTLTYGENAYYDAGAMAEAINNELVASGQPAKYSPQDIAWLRSQAYTPRDNSSVAIENVAPSSLQGDQMGSLLTNIAQVRAFNDAPIDLNNQTQMANLLYGRASGVNPMDINTNTPEGVQHALSYERNQTDDRWGQGAVKAGYGLMSIVGGAMGGAALGPLLGGLFTGAAETAGVGASTAGTIGSGVGTGMAAGIGSSTYPALVTGLEEGDWGKAAADVGKAAGIGGVVGGATAGVGSALGDTPTGPEGLVGRELPNGGKIIMTPSGPMAMVPSGTGSVSGILINSDNVSAILAGINPTNIVEDNEYEMDYGIRNDKTGDIWSYEDVVPDNAYEIDYGTPEQRLYGVPAEGKSPFGAKDLFRGLDFIPMGGTPPGQGTGLDNGMFLPNVQDNLPRSGNQIMASSSGLSADGMTIPSQFSQQYSAVRPVMENYTQDLMSMVQESPDMLENPTIMNMLTEQLQNGGGQTPKRYGLLDTFDSNAEAVM